MNRKCPVNHCKNKISSLVFLHFSASVLLVRSKKTDVPGSLLAVWFNPECCIRHLELWASKALLPPTAQWFATGCAWWTGGPLWLGDDPALTLTSNWWQLKKRWMDVAVSSSIFLHLLSGSGSRQKVKYRKVTLPVYLESTLEFHLYLNIGCVIFGVFIN